MNAFANIFYFNPFALLPLSTSLLTLSLGILVLTRASCELNRSFFLWCLSIFLWLFSYAINYSVTDPQVALFFIRLGCCSSSLFIACNLYYLVISYLKVNSEKKYLSLAFFTALLATPFFLTSSNFLYGPRKFDFGFYGIAGPYYGYMVFLFAFISFRAFYLLFKTWRGHSYNEVSSRQAKYFLISTLIAYIGAIDFLPKYGINIYPIGSVFILIWTGIVTYLIFKHQLFNFKIVLERGIVYSIVITCISMGYLLTVVVLENLFKTFFGYDSTSFSLFLVFILGLIVIPLRNRIQYILDRTLFKGTQPELAAENTLLRQEVIDKEKFKAVSTLASGLAHEIKNPLTAIKTFTEHIPVKKDDPEFIEKFSRIVGKEVNRINDLVHQLLEFSRPSAPKLEETSIQNVMEEVLEFLNSQFVNYHIKVEKNFQLNGTLLRIDPNQFRQVFLNLFINAIEAMPKGGVLTVATETVAAPLGRTLKGATTTVNEPHQSVSIIIQDTGSGIPPNVLKNLFQPFHTTKTKGTGLGLSISKNIIESHKGKIKVESMVGKGTKFMIDLPIGESSK